MGIKISTDSWHYKLANTFSGHRPPENLCGYFWKVIFSIFMSIFILFLALIFTMVVLSVFLRFWFSSFGEVAPLGGFVSIVILSIILAELVKARHEKERIDAIISGIKPKKSFIGVCFSWVKAKKDKYCPSIDFE